jgi:hypothetical protein
MACALRTHIHKTCTFEIWTAVASSQLVCLFVYGRLTRYCFLSKSLGLEFVVEVYRIVRCRGYHIFLTIGSQMGVRLPILRPGRPSLPKRFLVLNSVTGCVDPRAVVRLEVLGKLKNPMTSSVIETATFRLVALRIHQVQRHKILVFWTSWIRDVSLEYSI